MSWLVRVVFILALAAYAVGVTGWARFVVAAVLAVIAGTWLTRELH